MRTCIATTVLLIGAATASAQFSSPNQPPNFNPPAGSTNPFFRGTPVSPYLNIFNGTNAAANYYNLVRPTTAPLFTRNAFAPAATGSGRQTFFPVIGAPEPDDIPTQEEGPKGKLTIPPTGHPAGFGSTMGYFGTMGGRSPSAQKPPSSAAAASKGPKGR